MLCRHAFQRGSNLLEFTRKAVFSPPMQLCPFQTVLDPSASMVLSTLLVSCIFQDCRRLAKPVYTLSSFNPSSLTTKLYRVSFSLDDIISSASLTSRRKHQIAGVVDWADDDSRSRRQFCLSMLLLRQGKKTLSLPAVMEHGLRYLADHSPYICCDRPVGLANFFIFYDLSGKEFVVAPFQGQLFKSDILSIIIHCV